MPQESQQYSNKISVGKFIFYSIISVGIYELVWFYRHWKFLKEKNNLNISPFWRTVFAIFFITTLFDIMLKLSQKKGYKKTYSPGWLTVAWFVLAISGWFVLAISSRLPDLFGLISVFKFVPLIAPLNAINFYWDKNKKFPERTTKWRHILLIIVGIIWWILVFAGMFLPEV